MTEDLAQRLAQSDPDRFSASLAAPASVRPALWAIYAVNLEIARAPFAASDPLLAEMRLQWWIDQLRAIAAGKAHASEENLTALVQSCPAETAAILADLAEARRRDALREPLASASDVVDYIEQTNVRLTLLAAGFLQSKPSVDGVIRSWAKGAGIAAWLGALSRLQPLGLGLEKPDDALIQSLAAEGETALDVARKVGIPRAASPALAAPRARLWLKTAKEAPETMRTHPPDISEFYRRFYFARLAAVGIV